ncbi:DUF4275 family protein [Solibacillus sp. FSL H8-0538]|uniref:DUF4275 family protein n=1 Tax=Solibacillus sp. FSL H8-0538 TaxID=2921400 RepID=UPI0030FA1603
MTNIKEELYQLIQELPEKELANLLFYAEHLKKDFLYREFLQAKGVVITELYGEGDDIKGHWEAAFTSGISEDKKKEIYLAQFLWHVFSYEEVPCLQREDAMAALDELTKTEFYVFYQNRPLVTKFEHADKVKAIDFKDQQDIYIVDVNFNWTYVNTHEDQCGPYFYQLI